MQWLRRKPPPRRECRQGEERTRACEVSWTFCGGGSLYTNGHATTRRRKVRNLIFDPAGDRCTRSQRSSGDH